MSPNTEGRASGAHAPRPFRWTISKREQLGGLLAGAPRVNLHERGFLSDLRKMAARTVALANDADLAFIGRTPENLFDYLSGAFANSPDAPGLHLVHFSLRSAGQGGIGAIASNRLAGFLAYLREEGIDAASIARAPRPLALVDFVARGGTLRNLIALLHLQAERDGVDWNAVQRRLRVIGLRVRTHNSPNTWRWQQHQDWLEMIPDTIIKNVSAPAGVMYHLANDQPKLTEPFHPGRWDDPPGHAVPMTTERKYALRLAVKLYETGKTREERTRLAAEIVRQPQMRQSATRRLVSRLKGR